jgi:GTP-binding protein
VLDLAPLDGSDPVANWETVEAEIAGHGAGLERLPRILALSKADLVPPGEAERAASEWRSRLGDGALDVIVTSSATGRGVEELRGALMQGAPVEPPPAPEEAMAEHRVYRPAADEGFGVERVGDGAFRVSGPRVERLLARHDVDNDEALAYVEERLRAIGVIRALEAAGFEPGDEVEIAGTVFELDPGTPFRG